jgi:phosphate transport system substrate-binding protein
MARQHLVRLLPIAVTGLALAASITTASAASITGAGATFPAPVYAKWAEAYKAETGHALNYQAIGSGGGIRQIKGKTVDFGASDDPLPGDELTKDGLIQFPAVIGGVVPVVNVPGVEPGKMTLTGELLGKLFAGTIKKWNDPEVVKLNPGLKLPSTAVTQVYRSDSSGTTAVFTDYLEKASADFKTRVGSGKTVNWPSGIGGKGNAGVAANVSKIGGALGYVEYAFAKQNKLSHTALVNAAGKTVQPDNRTFAAAAADADWTTAPGFGISLNDQKGADAWPITSATFILMHRKAEKPEQSAETLKFFDWAMTKGEKLALDLDYVPLPKKTIERVTASWKEIQDQNGKAVLEAK